MANLQDLFNELQADDRIINPDTFEEFQSSMEDPDYAARVEDVLSRNGYDVNAYEGLKKKEESMDESAALSQQELQQPSEVTDPIQTVGTEPTEEVVSENPIEEEPFNINELDINQFSIATQSPEIEMPISAVGVNPISSDQNKNVVEPIQNQVAPTQDDTDHPVSKITNLAKNLKKKLTDNPFIAMSKDIALGTAAFSMDEDEVENTLDAQEDVDTDKDKKPKDKKNIKRRDAKQISDETGMDYSNYNYFYKALGRTKIYGVKTNAEKGTVELIYKNQDDPGSRAIIKEVPIGSATYKEWVEPQLGGGGTSFYDYNGDENGWDDLKKATLTVSGYSPKIEGQDYPDDLGLNFEAHLKKTNRLSTYITNPISIPSDKGEEKKDKTFFEKVVDYTKEKVSDVEQGVVRAKEYLQEKEKKRQEDIETYKIAQQTVENTSYVTKADESFRSSPFNSNGINDILEKYQIPINELLLDGNKEQILNKIEFDYLKDFNPKITTGNVNGLPGQELSPFAEDTRDEYAKRLKEAKRAEAERLYNRARTDAQFHLAELAIMNQIEKGNKKFRFQDIERLRDIKAKGLDAGDASYYARNPEGEGVDGQAAVFGLRPGGETEYNAMVNIQDARFAREMIGYATSEYTDYYKSLGGMSASKLEEKGISNDARSLNGRKKELSTKILDAKKKYNIPEDGVVDKAVKGAKAVVTEMSAIDKQIEEKINQYNAMLIEEDGKKVFKNESDLATGEKLRGEVDALVKKRDEVKLKMNEFNPVLDVVQKYSDETRDAYNEITTIETELNRFGSDADVKILQELSPTLELIESYDLNKQMTIDPETGRPYAWVTGAKKQRGELGDFTMLNTYEDNVEASEKIKAENDTWVESFGRGLVGGGASMTYGIFSTLNYFNPDFVSDDPNTWSSADRRKEFYRGSQEAIGRATVNPAYEEWSPQWIAASLGSIAPSILGAIATGGVAPSTALFATMSIGNYALEFEKAGYSSEASIAGGILLGVTTARMESLMPEIPTFQRIAMKSAIKKVIAKSIKEGLAPDQIAKKLLNGFWKTTGKSAVNILGHGVQEAGVEEGPQFLLDQGVMTIADVRESDIIDPQTGEFGETTKEFFNTLGIAVISGGTLGGFSNIATLINEKRTNLVGKQTQLAIATNFDNFVDQAIAEDDKFKESKTYTQIKNIKDRYDEMASNPKFQEFDDVAKGEILNANINLTEMINADKALQSKGITDIKLQEDIKGTQEDLNKLFEVSQERVDQRNELNNQLKELGVTAFQVNAEGKVSGMQFDEYTTTEEQNENTPKIVELIEKTNTKTQENAIQEPSTGEVLQRQPQETGETGSERKGVEPVLEGEKPAKEGWKEKIKERLSQLRELLASDNSSKEQTGSGNLLPEAKQEILNEIETLEKKSQEAPQEGGKKEVKVGSTIKWNVFGNQETGDWTVLNETTTRQGKPAVTLSKVYVEDRVTGKKYTKEYADKNNIKYDNEYTVEHIVPLADLKNTQETTQEGGKEEVVATPQEAKEQEAMQNDIDQVQQSTGTVINLNEDGTLTINPPARGGQSKKDAAIENAKQELTNLGYNVGSRITPAPTISPTSSKDTETKKSEIESRRKEALKEYPIPALLVKEFVADGDNKLLEGEDADIQNQRIEKTIASGIKNGLSRENIFKMLAANGHVFNFGNDTVAMNNYIQNRIDGKDTRNFSEFKNNPQEQINAKYDTELAALEEESTPQFQLNLNNSISEDERKEVESLFEESSNNPENTPSEVFNIDEDLPNNIPFSEIKIDNNDGREESTIMSKMRIPLNFIFGKRVGLGMSDTLTTGEREVDVMDAKTGKIKKEKVREEGGIGYPFKTLLDLLNGKSKPNQKHFGWAAVGKGAASAMVNAAKKASKITGKELKDLYIKNLGLDKNQISILNKTISDNEEFGLVTIYKMGDEGIRSNEAFTREAFRMIETMLSEEEKQKFFELAEDRLNNLVWEEKEKYLPLIASAKNFIELENILHGKDSKLSLGVKASIMQKVFLSTESTESKENVNPIGSLLKEKGITMESISRNIEEPIMSGVQKGNPVILVAIKTNVNTDTQISEDVKRERHNNYPFGVEGFPIGVFNETTQMHQLSPEMMDTFVKTSTTQETQAKKSRKKQRVVVYQNQNGEFLAEQGTGVDKLPIKDKTGNVISANSREGLIQKLTDLGYSFSPEFINAPYAPTINGTTYNNLLQKAKKGLIDIFLTPKMTSQQQVVSLLQKAFPGIVVNMTEKDFNEKEKQLKSEGNSAQLLTKNQKIYGFIDKGVVYINPQFINNNTIIHEYGHIWNLVAQKQFPEIHKKGIELVQNSQYIDRVLSDSSYQKVMKNIFGNDIFVRDKSTKKITLNTESQNYELASKYLSDEALSTAIGDKGELFLNEAQKRNFLDWIKELFGAIKNVIGFKSITPEQLSNMTLSDFTNAVIKDLLGGKKISDITSEDLKDLETKFQIDINAEESPLYQRRTKEDVPFVSNEQVRKDVPKMGGQTQKTEAKNIKVEPGMLVGSRINIPVTRDLGYPVLTIHRTYAANKKPKENTNASSGEAISQRGNITLSNVNFNVSQSERNKIAEGRAKGVMAMAVGRVMDVEPNFDGIELSFNPAREHLFVDANGRAVKSAEEVTVMGFKAYARGKITYLEEFEDPRSPEYTAPSQTKFAKTKEELVKMADDVETGNTTVEEVGVPELAPEAVSEAITTFSDAIENGSTIEEATEEMEIVLANSAEQGPRKVTPPTEKTEPTSANKKEEKPKAEKKEKTEGPVLSDSETIVAFTIAGNAKSIMDVTGVTQSEAVNQAVLEMTNGDQESADRYLAQPGVKDAVNNRVKQIKAKAERQLESESPKITISERKLLLDRVKAEIKAALEGFKEGKQEGVDQAQEKAQKTIDALNKKLEEGKITKQELQDRVKELGYNIRFEAGVARLAGEKAGKTMGKRIGEFIGYFKGLKAGRTEQRGLGALVSEYIKDVVDNEFGKKGSVSPATLKSISRRAATISNQKQLDAFMSYLDKIIANKRLAEGINEIQRQQKKLLNKLGYQYTTQMKQFAKFDLYTADGDLAFDMNTLEDYLQALQDLNLKVPNIGKMMQLFDGMNDINQQNMPADLDAVDEFKKYQDASAKLFQNTVINNFDDYKKFKREVNKYIRAVNNLLDLGVITELQHESFINSVVDGDAKYDTYAGQFQDEIDALKKTIADGIVDKGTNSLWDSIKDWLTNAPNNFTRNQKKLLDQLQRAKAANLMTLSLDDLDLLNQVVTQIAENGFVDEKNLRSILDRAEIRGEKIGEQIIAQSSKMSSKYKGPNAFMKMSLDVLNKAVVFWESRLGMKENGAFRKNVIDPITNAVNGWTEDTQRILKGYRDSVVKLKVKGKLKIKTTKFEKGKIVPTGKTRKVSKEAYRRVKIGVIGHILDNAWNAKQKKKNVNDWLGSQLGDNSTRNSMAEESVDELDIVQDIYNDLLEQFPDGNGGLDHMAVLEAFENPTLQSSVMSADELEYYNAARSTLQEAGEYINSANAIRNKQHELNPYYMPRQSVGVGMGSVTSNDISYNQELGTALRSSASYARTLQVPKEAIRFNVDRLVATNVNEGLRDYYLTEAKRYVNEVFSNARENATNEETDVLKTLQRLNNTRIPYALRKTNPVMIATPLLNTFYTNALIGIYRTPVEFFNNIISYSLGNRSSKSVTMPFTTKEKEQTNNLLSEFQSSVQFEEPEKETRFINKKWYQSSKGVNGLISTQKGHQLLIPMLNNITAFMRKGEWKTQFDRAFENITGEKFNYEKHFVKEKDTYFEDMEQASSDADFNVRRIIKGGNKSEQRQFVQWVPFVKKGRVDADSFAASFLGMFSGFIGHDVDNMTIGLRKTIKPGEVKDGVTQFLGAAMRLSLYPTLMLVAKALGKMYFGDDDEKEEGKETIDTLKTPEGLVDLSLYTFKQLIATTVMGKYAFGGKVVGNFLLHASYTMTEDRRQRRFIEDTMRELYFTDPIDLKYFNKDDWELQMTANLEPITKMLGEALNDISKDISNKGKERVTLYDLYEWTQQTEEGKQWMSLAGAVITLGQVTSIALTGTAIPLVDDIVKVAEDYINQKEPNENTLYKTPSGKQVDMLDLILNDDGMIDINVPGITQRDRDRYSQLATEKFKKSLPQAYNEGFPEDKYAYLKYLRDKAKYDAGKELGYPYEGWSQKEGEMISSEPIPWFDQDPVPDDEVLRKNLDNDVVKQKQLSFTQNIKEKRKVEDYMFKELDKNPELKQDYENAPDGGKLGVREYFKEKYLYDKYKLTEPPVKSNYFNKEGGKIKQVEKTPEEGN